jgi:excisionase family DNA binding protein
MNGDAAMLANPQQSLAGVAPEHRVVLMLQEIRAAIEDIRSQLAGTHKSHYTVEEVAELTGRTPYTVRRWIAEGRLRATRVHGTGPKGRLLISHDQLLGLVEAGLGAQIPPVVAASSRR